MSMASWAASLSPLQFKRSLGVEGSTKYSPKHSKRGSFSEMSTGGGGRHKAPRARRVSKSTSEGDYSPVHAQGASGYTGKHIAKSVAPEKQGWGGYGS
jgi:hypothetical protein